ncbi:MAG: M48 family metallopeptidase [Bryobacterales bacterium]|nr:M48 family metallopeptidase [Bryobacterales bacterium]
MQSAYPAQLGDGVSPPQSVQVILAPHGIAIQPADGPQLWWPFEQTQIHEQPQRVHIARGPQFLILEDQSLLADWHRIRNSGKRERDIAISLVIAAIVIIGLLLTAAYYGLSFAASAFAKLVPRSTEETLGRAALESLAPKSKRCLDPAINRIAETLGATLPDSPYTFRVYVVNDPTMNAFAAPGGYIVIYRGLLDKTRKPEQAAAVLAHEMQHVLHRHSVKGMLRGVSIWLALALLTGDPTDTLAAIAGNLGSLHYQRADEQQADRDGLEMMGDAGIDPHAMVGMLELLDQVSGDMPRAAKYLSSHPLTGDRIEDIRQRAARANTKRVTPLLPSHRWPPDPHSCVAEGSPSL